MSNDNEPVTPLREAAGQLHEMYITLKEAGFTRSEAMEILAKVLASSMNEAQGNDE
jgi:hypothetical protein